mmetsp:Transcript_16769/g.50168  ORF Transcript_16769/g.50168 Transcript_16769/m.50168 type:complete len:206 (+) Transcript_16769:410-1027(+)
MTDSENLATWTSQVQVDHRLIVTWSQQCRMLGKHAHQIDLAHKAGELLHLVDDAEAMRLTRECEQCFEERVGACERAPVLTSRTAEQFRDVLLGVERIDAVLIAAQKIQRVEEHVLTGDHAHHASLLAGDDQRVHLLCGHTRQCNANRSALVDHDHGTVRHYRVHAYHAEHLPEKLSVVSVHLGHLELADGLLDEFVHILLEARR